MKHTNHQRLSFYFDNMIGTTSGWLSTSKQKSLSVPSDTVTESLPLDWTRLGVKRKRSDQEEECCKDPLSLCRHRSSFRFNGESTIVVDEKRENIHQGQAIFCLHDVSPSWFQGYFVSSHLQQPLGLLAVQEEIDKCLECASGGYRRLTMNIFTSPNRIKYSGIDWTGGDMIRLTNDKVEMETNRLVTGSQTLPYLKKYFEPLMTQIQQECSENETKQDTTVDEIPILDLIPNVTIVVGQMSIVLPKNEQEKTKSLDDDNLWQD